MAYVGIAAGPSGPCLASTGGSPAAHLERLISRTPENAPIVILVHGYRYDPGRRTADPQRHIYAFRDVQSCRKIRSWPLGLGFSRHGFETGLCIGFGWPARLPHVETLLRRGRTGFSQVYADAARHGAGLARLIDMIHRVAPQRRVEILAHSLGARVALSALPLVARAPGRIILLGAAEYQSAALSALGAIRTTERPEIYNVTARFNDLYDAMFETFAPKRAPGDRALGQGLGQTAENWLDIQIDRPDVTAWINERGIPLHRARARFCHWSFYTRGGALDVYEAILRRRPGWDIETLRMAPCFRLQDSRWSHLRPWRSPSSELQEIDAAQGLREA